MGFKIYYFEMITPIGMLKLYSTKKGLCYLQLPSMKNKKAVNWLENNYSKNISFENKVDNNIQNQLQKYFSGSSKRFNLKFDIKGTEFQKKVWKELKKIPFGKTISYKTIAQRIGSKNSYRAVGNANGKNPIAIIIPCHRVIANNGKLGGYSGGLKIKNYLLNLEKSF